MSSTKETVKRSIYLEKEVDEALRVSAKLNQRSLTSQLNYLLRQMLIGPERQAATTLYYDVSTAPPFSGPDPKAKPKLKAVGSPKKLT